MDVLGPPNPAPVLHSLLVDSFGSERDLWRASVRRAMLGLAVVQPAERDADQARAAEQLRGTVERVVYHDERTRYTVLRVAVAGMTELVTVVGRTSAPEVGAEADIVGSWSTHPTHGRQFAFDRIKVAMPTTLAGIERRLTRYPGVKDVMAARIVARFGMDTLEILEKQPNRLTEVEGIGPRTRDKIVEYHRDQVGPLAELEAHLLELDIPAHFARPLFDRYAEDALSVVRTQPYRLAREVRGIGFLTADRMARSLGLAPDSPERIDAGMIHALEQAESDGHCGLPIEVLVRKAGAALGVEDELVRESGERLVGQGDLVLEYGSDGTPLCFPARFVAAERAVAEALAGLAKGERESWPLLALRDGLSEGQIAAVQAVATHGVVVLTGGPGTGKSTVVREIIELARDRGMDLQLCAPTGRAAKRLAEAAGADACTIHRLLEFQPENGRFLYGAGNPLPPALCVVDESSMLDIQLAQALLEALTPQHRLLLVGDADQLPSVGPGNVLHDVMQAAVDPSSTIALVRLVEVFRQARGSTIVDNAHRILRGELPRADAPGQGGEFFVVPAKSPEHAHELVVKLATERIPQAYGLDGPTEIQVLCPMHKGRGGTEAINEALQAKHTAGAPELEITSARGQLLRRYRVGDRVMQMKNDYGKAVFNGDVGVVASVDAEIGELVVQMDDARVTYAGNEALALGLAYAVSIHKSQGSEFPAVIVTLLPEHHVMLRRNLLYTAVTRARRLCVVVGDPRAIEQAVRRTEGSRRHTGLARRLREALGGGSHESA